MIMQGKYLPQQGQLLGKEVFPSQGLHAYNIDIFFGER